MTDALKKKLTASVVKLLRPLVRILLRYGISFGEFAEMARRVFVDVADRDFSIAGRKQTVSRISVITGLNRKDVTRLKKTGIHDDQETFSGINRAGRVVSGWVRDKAYHSDRGIPADLPLEGEMKSFAALVRQFSGDMPVRAVLDELLRIEAVRKNADNTVSLLINAYIPKNVDAEKITILGTDGADLLSSIDHNLSNSSDPPFFQRKVVYDNIPAEAVAGFREISSAEGQQLLERLNVILAGHDRDANPSVRGAGRKRVGVGIYYFEEDIAETSGKKAKGQDRSK